MRVSNCTLYDPDFSRTRADEPNLPRHGGRAVQPGRGTRRWIETVELLYVQMGAGRVTMRIDRRRRLRKADRRVRSPSAPTAVFLSRDSRRRRCMLIRRAEFSSLCNPVFEPSGHPSPIRLFHSQVFSLPTFPEFPVLPGPLKLRKNVRHCAVASRTTARECRRGKQSRSSSRVSGEISAIAPVRSSGTTSSALLDQPYPRGRLISIESHSRRTDQQKHPPDSPSSIEYSCVPISLCAPFSA